MNANPLVMRYFPKVVSPDESDDLMARIQTHFDEFGYGFYAAESKASGEFFGFIGLKQVSFDASFAPAVEIGWRLHPNYWNEGLATEGAKAVLSHGFRHLGLEQIVSFTAAINTPSERVMQKIGLQKAGEFNHPLVSADSELYKHVLYWVKKEEWSNLTANPTQK